jgi:hypothetical protein
VLRKLDLKDFGSQVVKFGRLGSAGALSALFVQVNYDREITCLTAVSLDTSEVLWQLGTPDASNYKATSEIPVQVFDWNEDGFDDVIFAQSGSVAVVNGADASRLASVQAETPYSMGARRRPCLGPTYRLCGLGRMSSRIFRWRWTSTMTMSLSC